MKLWTNLNQSTAGFREITIVKSNTISEAETSKQLEMSVEFFLKHFDCKFFRQSI